MCAPLGSQPICSVDPGTVPKAVDVITPAGVSQSTELDPTLGPVEIQPVIVPGGCDRSIRAARGLAYGRDLW